MFSELSPDNTALIVIDMSLDFLQVGAPFETTEGRDMMPNLVRFIRHCREVKLPIIYLNHVHHPGANDMGSLADRFSVIPRWESGTRRNGGRHYLAGNCAPGR